MTRFPRRVLVVLITLVLALVGASLPAVATTTVAPSGHRGGGGVQPPVVSGINVDTATIPQLQRLMDRGRLSSEQLVRFYLQRIRALNPTLHAVITTSGSAVSEARAADRARRHGDHRALLGIPVIVKDNIDTSGMPTTAGSLALKGSTPPDAFIVERLEAAGAIIIAKANLSEWANYRGFQSSSGWSAVGGQTNNPYVLDRNPCGSSSGSAVAAASDLATVAIGTETDGSIVCPSGQNGVVGIKPTLGLASRTGIVPISAQQDTAGPITRNVTDAAVVLGALTGVDPHDAATKAQPGNVTRDYTKYLKANSLEGARIGVWRSKFGTSPEADAVMTTAIARLQQSGATIVDNADIPIEAAYDDENTALQYEFKHDIATYLQNTAPRYPKSLQDLIDFNNAHPGTELKYFGQEIFLAAQARGPLTDPEYVAARTNARTIAQKAIDDTMASKNLDAIIAPTNTPAWPTDLVSGDNFLLGSSSPAAISGYANITVPAGYSFGLPVGMSFIGGKWDEPTLIGLAYAWEQATHVRKAPRFLPTLPAR